MERSISEMHAELFFGLIFHWISMTICISGYHIIGQHRKQTLRWVLVML